MSGRVAFVGDLGECTVTRFAPSAGKMASVKTLGRTPPVLEEDVIEDAFPRVVLRLGFGYRRPGVLVSGDVMVQVIGPEDAIPSPSVIIRSGVVKREPVVK